MTKYPLCPASLLPQPVMSRVGSFGRAYGFGNGNHSMKDSIFGIQRLSRQRTHLLGLSPIIPRCTGGLLTLRRPLPQISMPIKKLSPSKFPFGLSVTETSFRLMLSPKMDSMFVLCLLSVADGVLLRLYDFGFNTFILYYYYSLVFLFVWPVLSVTHRDVCHCLW